LKSQNFIV